MFGAFGFLKRIVSQGPRARLRDVNRDIRGINGLRKKSIEDYDMVQEYDQSQEYHPTPHTRLFCCRSVLASDGRHYCLQTGIGWIKDVIHQVSIHPSMCLLFFLAILRKVPKQNTAFAVKRVQPKTIEAHVARIQSLNLCVTRVATCSLVMFIVLSHYCTMRVWLKGLSHITASVITVKTVCIRDLCGLGIQGSP